MILLGVDKVGNDVKQYNSTVSIFRAIAALLVISQHVPYEGSLRIIYYFMGTAVPFFFLVAGYFSWDSDQSKRKTKIIKHLRKMVIIYILAYVFYYLISVGLKYGMNEIFHTSIQVEFENWNILQIIKGILLDIDPFASHLWFLYSMIIIYVIFFIFHRDKCVLPVFVLSVILYSLAHTKYGEGDTLATIRVSVTSSFSTAYFGYYVHYLEEKKGNILEKNSLLIITVIVGIMYLLNHNLLINIFIYDNYTEYVAFILFLLALKYKDVGKDSILDKLGREYSLGIYILHVFIMHMWSRLQGKIMFIPEKVWKEINVFIVYLISAVIVLGYHKVIIWVKIKRK